MMKKTGILIITALVLSLMSCSLVTGTATAPASATPPVSTTLPVEPTPSLPPTEAVSPTASPTSEESPAAETPPAETQAPATETQVSPATGTPTVQPDPRGEEAILILQPGPGSRLTSPLLVAGEANSTFEQHLAVSIVLDDGTVLTTVPAIIDAELGQRGPFEVEVPFEVDEERQGFIQVYDTSARDGGVIHLASVGVTLAPDGEEDIVPVEPHPERIAIFQPTPGAVVSGGTAHVEGFALASFEQTLVVQVQDADGNVVGQEPVIVNAPDLGQPGPFSVDVPYTVSAAGPGRIAVRDISPAFGGDSHVASVEISLEP